MVLKKVALLPLILGILFVSRADRAPNDVTASEVNCSLPSDTPLPNAKVINARFVPAGKYSISALSNSQRRTEASSSPEQFLELPSFCRYNLEIKPHIGVEVWLPQATWNGRFRAVGGGYYNGFINFGKMGDALRAGYATASTDSGHKYDFNNVDVARHYGDFALKSDGTLDYEAIENFAWRSQYEMVRKAKTIIAAHYGRRPLYSYWDGCSTGGREGLAAAQRFPEEFDGILSACPAINWDRFMLAGLWAQTVMHEEIGHPIAAAKLQLATQAAIAACDTDDGVSDGIINDPRSCRYDPSALLCKTGISSDRCLTQQEVTAIRKIWEGPTSHDGKERLWFGIERGADLSVVANPKPGEHPHGSHHIMYWLKQNPKFEWRNFKQTDYEEALRTSHKRFNAVIGTDDPNLTRLRRSGAKLIVWHGWSDEIIFPRGTVNYFERAMAANRGPDATAKFARLYMIPGLGHVCSANDKAPFPSDFWRVLVDWVERGIAPDRIIASQQLSDGRVRTRPLCPYPRIARWKRHGDTDNAANFECVQGPKTDADNEVMSLQ